MSVPPDPSSLPPGDDLQQEIERLQTEPWRAPRGPKTRFFAWVILFALGLCLLALLAILVADFSGAVAPGR